MEALIILALIAVGIFIAAFYQSHRDRKRWERIVQGKSLVVERDWIPPLELAGKEHDSGGKNVLVIWGDSKATAFSRLKDARVQVEKEQLAGKSRAVEAKLFVWDGDAWRPC
jgi:hypothetical protein